jgi:hypothetical protein
MFYRETTNDKETGLSFDTPLDMGTHSRALKLQVVYKVMDYTNEYLGIVKTNHSR